MRNLALIGGGYWGKNLVRDFYNLGALHTVCDINIELLASHKLKYPEIETSTNWDEVLTNNCIDRVCIALPAHLHYTFAKKSLEAGKHVYVEKPITLDISQAEELNNMAKEKGLILMVGHLLQYHPGIQKIKAIIKSGKIGTVKQIIANRFSLGIFRTFENVLWSFAVHDISVILSLCNDMLPNSVVCNGASNITSGIQDITNSVLKYDDKYVSLNVNWLSPYKEQKLTVVGTKGMLVFDDVEKKITIVPEFVKYEHEINPHNPIAIKNNSYVETFNTTEYPLTKECKHFIYCCDNNSQPITDGDEGVRVLKVLTKLQESLDNNGCSISLKKNTNNIFIHETAVVDDGAMIGQGTKIWHYSHICKGAQIGKNCNIGQNVFIAGGAVIGDNCKVQNNVSIYAGVRAGNHVFFGPSCVLTNDINPRCLHSKNGKYIETIIEDGVTLGANSTVVCGNIIKQHSLIGAGAVVCKDVEANSVIVGNPGKLIGTIDEKGNRTPLSK
jgi:UDP-2-acetamido-3-amino-2,3-dideoxy-glucuronate N-acetyltransferase